MKREYYVFLVLIISSLLTGGLDNFHYLDWIKRPVEAIVNPLKLRLSRSELQIKTKRLTVNETIKLHEKTTKLELENAKLLVDKLNLEQENSSMRKLLSAPLPVSWKFIPAHVLTVNENDLLIDQGFDVGIKLNDPVVWETALVGKVSKVDPQQSLVNLPVDKETKIRAKLLASKIKGIIIVDSNGRMLLDEVLPEKKVSEGQLVVTAGDDNTYPADLVIAKVEEIEKDEASVFQKIILKPFLEYSFLETVFIIKNN